jgi:hypothetical protein
MYPRVKGMRAHMIVYAVFIGFVLLDLVTSIICFQRGLAETNPLYQIVGVWAFPLVYLVDAGILLAVERLRKYMRWSPTILLILILAYAKACVTNLQLIAS